MGVLSLYRYVMYDLADPRWKNYFLVETPWPVLFIICNYIYFVKVCGPKFMKNREAFKIEWLIKVYNTVQIIWNLNLFFYVFRIAYHAQFMEDFNAWCLPLNCSEDDAFSMMLFHGGNTTTTGIVNGLIHVMMYSYYQLALLGYTVWWKKYLTQMQIIQFVIVFIHNLAVFFVKSCNYGLFITLLTLVQAIYFIYMFTNFYLKTYRKEIKKN
ncbi:Elongation of very long chain fatty acids protein [Gryllus bimaculatus]|nr:Elongation of very long chain fatty acids protein [Gryllus bimaculatus]